MKREAIIMSWSGGKDSAFALYHILKSNQYDVKYLLTTIYKPNKRVSMHGVPEHLIEQQAKSIGITLIKIYIAEKTHDEYDIKMKETLLKFKQEGINTVAFGDIFLEDLKLYREQRLAEVEMNAHFPLWGKNTKTLAHQFIKEGFKTHICSIDSSKISDDLIGVDFSIDFLEKLNDKIDPCGENGEFHSFCYAGPIYNKEVEFKVNGIASKEYKHDNIIYKYLFSDIK
ncbi:MAG: diphthine--ammonia ligase [Vicingaceae bacterium]